MTVPASALERPGGVPYLTLGDVVLEPIAVTGLDSRQTFDWPAYDVVSGLPRLSFGGPQLELFTLALRLDRRWGAPATALARLRGAAARGEALPLVYGSGHVRGRFVVTELQVTATRTDARGGLLTADLQLGLSAYDAELGSSAAPRAATGVPDVEAARRGASVPRGTPTPGRRQVAAIGRDALRSLAVGEPLGTVAQRSVRRAAALARGVGFVPPGGDYRAVAVDAVLRREWP